MSSPGREPPADSVPAGDAGHPVTALYLTYYRPLVRLAVLLLPDPALAEDIVQDSFAALRSSWPGTPDADGLGYLRRSVVHRSRLARHAGKRAEHSAFASALWTLPARHREVLALRYFDEVAGTTVASASGASRGAVRSRVAWAGLLRRGRDTGGRRAGWRGGHGTDEVDGPA